MCMSQFGLCPVLAVTADKREKGGIIHYLSVALTTTMWYFKELGIEGIAGSANSLLRYSRILTSMPTPLVTENTFNLSMQSEPIVVRIFRIPSIKTSKRSRIVSQLIEAASW